jgi:hypothetical protein
MIVIDNILVSDDVVEKQFVCDHAREAAAKKVMPAPRWMMKN